MDYFDNLLAQAAGTTTTPSQVDNKSSSISVQSDIKKQNINSAGKQKMLSIGGTAASFPTSQDFRKFSVGSDTGYGAASMTEIETDMRLMNPAQLYQKYGDQASELIQGQVAADTAVRNQNLSRRSTPAALYDLTSGAANAAVITVGNIGALVGGIFSPDFGTAAAGKVKEFGDFVQSTQSDALNAQRALDATSNELDSRDNASAYTDDMLSGNDKILSTLKREGRNALGAAGIAVSSGVSFSDGLANAVGSMGPVGKVAGAISVLGSKVPLVGAAIQKSAVPLAIGAIEGAGAYGQSATNILGKSFADLEKSSPYYLSLIAQGLTPDQARTKTANNEALLAAAIQAPVAVAAGKLVSKFEGNPLKVPTGTSVLGNTAREAVEEGIQGGTGQVSQNIAATQFSDPNRDVASGVGQQVGEGALFGLSSAATLQAPAASTKATVDGISTALDATTELLTKLGTPVYDYLGKRGESASKAIDAKAPNATTKTAEIVQAAQASFTEGLPAVEQAIQDIDGTPEEKTAATEYIRDFAKVTSVDMTQLDGFPAPDAIKEIYKKSTNKAELLDKLEELITFGKADDATKLVATMMVFDMAEEVANYSENFPDLLAKIPKNSPAEAYIRQFDDVAAEINGTAAIQAVRADFAKKRKDIQNTLLKPVDEATIDTPAAQENIQNHLAVAAIAPDKADEKALNIISMQAARGKVNLTDSQKLHLTTAQTLLAAAREYQAEAARLGLRKTDVVNGQITVDKDRLADGEKSAFTHATGIRYALNKGNTELAKRRLEDFIKFAQHMSNKVGALNEHFRTGNGDRNKAVGFAALDPVTREFIPSELKLAVNPRSQGSLSFAQRVSLEANTVGGIANALAQAYPELGVQPVTVEPLAPALLQKFDAKSPIKSPKADSKKETAAPEVKKAEKKSISAMSLDELNAEAEAYESGADGDMDANDQLRYASIRVEIGKRDLPKAERDAEIAKERADWVKTLSVSELESRLEGVDKQDDPELFKALSDELEIKNVKPKTTESAPTVRAELESASVTKTAEADKPSDKAGNKTVQKSDETAPIQEEPKQLVGENIPAAVEDTNNEPALDQPTFDPEGLEVGTPEYDEALTEWIAEQEAERLAAQEKSEGIVALYPNLYRGNGITNFLHEAFTVSLDRVSRLVGIGTPIAVLRNAIKSTVSFSEFIGKQSETKLTKQAITDYSAFLDTGLEIKTVMEKHLQSFLKTGRVSNETKFRNGVEANRWMNGKLLNIVEQTPKGFEYNQELLEGAILAGMQWMLSAPKYRNDVEKKDVTVFLRGTTTVDDLPEYVLNAYRRGFTHLETISAITKKIQEYWGLQGKSSADVGYTLGIPQNMAIQVFTAMQELKLIEVEKISVDSGISFELYRAVDLPEDAIGIRNFKNLIDKLVLPKPEQEFYLGDSVPSVPKNIMRSPYVKNTRRGRKAIQAAINTKYYLNLPMIESYESLGLQNMLLMFGNGELDKYSYNKNDLETKEGQNLALTAAFGELIALKAQVGAFAEVANVELDQVNIHYGFNMSSVSRLQMLGSFTPQSSKAVREAVLPTRSTLNLSANRKPYKFFFLGLAQALGEKIGHYTLDESVTKAQKILTVKLKESVGIAQQFLTNGYMPEVAAQDIKSNFNEQGIELSHVAWHAVLEYARFTLQENKTAFTTSIYVEADGITNGMMNSMAMLTTGYYTISEVENLAKGGLFFNGVRTNAEHWANDQVDLYKSIAGTLQGRLQGTEATFAGTKLDNNLKALNDLFDMFLSGADLNESGDLTVSRNVAKNPATITLYGSGAEGISYNIANEILSAIYSRMSLVIKAKQNDPKAKFSDAFFAGMPGDKAEMLKKFNNAIEVLTNQAIVTEFGKLKLNTVKHTKALNTKYDEFTIDGTYYSALASNIQHLFVKPLRESIAETVGDSVIETSKLIGKATQIQSVILENIFRQEVARKLEEKAKDSKWRQSDFLSINDQREIFKKLSVLSPFIQTEDQTFFIAGKQNVRGADGGSNPNISSSFEEKYRTEGFLYGPSNSGVAGRASIVIGTGDGNTMQLALTDPKAPTKALPVFDGINLALDNLEQDSEVINKAVKDAWKVNTIASLVTSYSNLISSINNNVYDSVLIADLTALFFPFGSKKPITPDVLKNKLADVKNNLEQTAIAIQNRLETRDLVDLRIDQMAGVGSSTNQKGIELGTTSQEIVKNLNGILSKNIRKNSDISSKSEEKPITSILKEYGRTLKNGAVELNWTSLFRLSNVLNIPQDRLETFSEILKSFNTKDYKVIFGSPEQIAEYQTSSNYQKLTAEQAKKLPKGYTVYSDKAIYIVNPTTETLIHELIHAATFEKIYDHYLNKTSNEQITQSVANLETLMKQFLEMEKDISFLSEETLNAYLDTKFAIETELNKTSKSAAQTALNKTHALNEFMAWTLSNESLVKTLKLTEANPVVLFLSKAIRAIKKLIWGNNIAPYVGTDMFSNIKFNTAIIVKSKPTVVEMSNALVSFQSSAFGNNQRLVNIREALSKKVYEYLQSGSDITETKARSLESANAKINSLLYKKVAEDHHFAMTPQERSTYLQIVHSLSTLTEIDPTALAKAQDIYSHVVKTLSVEDFMADPQSQNPADRAEAQDKYNVILGNFSTRRDSFGRTGLLPNFMGLALVNEQFRAILAKMDMPEPIRNVDKDLNSRLENLGFAAVDALAEHLSNTRNSPNVQRAIDGLTERIVETIQDDEQVIERYTKPVGNFVDNANQYIVENASRLAKTGIAKADTLLSDPKTNRATRVVSNASKLILSLVSEDDAQRVAEGIISNANRIKLWTPIRELLSDFVGRTDSNAAVYDLIKRVRVFVQQTRQQYRENVPTVIASKFTRTLADEEWTLLFNGLAKTDLASLAQNKQVGSIVALLQDPKKVDAEIARLTAEVRSNDPKNAQALLKKSEQLATYMTTGKVGNNLLRNSYSIARLFNEKIIGRVNATQQSEEDIDRLVSLMALNMMPKVDRNSLTFLVQEQPEGVSFALSYLVGQRKDEMYKANTPTVMANYYKGYVPSESTSGLSLLIVKDSDYGQAAKMSYRDVGYYEGSSADRFKGKRTYMFAPVTAKADYSQGIMQNIRQTAGGVDIVTGLSHDVMTAGAITKPELVRQTLALMHKETGAEPLLPVFDPSGRILAFERSVNPDHLQLVKPNTHLAKMLGVWRGRQVEQINAQVFNETLVDSLFSMYQKDITSSPSSQAEYVDLFAVGNDPVIVDAMKLLTKPAKDYIKAKFGDEFWVRKDMVNDAIGFRVASIGDVWTGNSRWSPRTLEEVKKLALGVMGNKAYYILTAGEKIIQNYIKDARVLIVVKSMVVPAANLVSTTLQLVARGVPLADIVRGMPRKTAEVNSYIRTQLRKVEAEAELRAATGDIRATRRLTVEIQGIVDGHKRLSIWPLIQAGEFSAISDAGISRDEILLSEGRLHAYMESLVAKLPLSVQTAGKYALITKDTALFQGIQKVMEYGDFLGKALLYDDLVKRQKQTPAYALGRVTEEFVNYDRLSGRWRSYLENTGMLWFYNYKIRIAKIAASMVRNNPVHALLGMLVPLPDAIGLPIEDNVFSKAIEGTLPYSMGLGQALRAPMLNPWANLIN